MSTFINAAGCSRRCCYCVNPDRGPSSNIYSKNELLALAEEWGPLTVWYDPAGHAEFPSIMDPRITGPQDTLISNAFALAHTTDPGAVFQTLRGFGYTAMHLYLHGMGRSHDTFVGCKGAFDAVLEASASAAQAGFDIHWTTMLDSRNLEEVPKLVTLNEKGFGGTSRVIAYPHYVGRSTWRYEKLRPSLAAVQSRLPNLVELDPQTWCPPLEDYTEESWARKWDSNPKAEEFMDPSEPRAWPPVEPFVRLTFHILRDRKVYLNPMSAPLMCLGELIEGREVILERLRKLSDPVPWSSLESKELELPRSDLLHPSGSSVRYKAISQRLFY